MKRAPIFAVAVAVVVVGTVFFATRHPHSVPRGSFLACPVEGASKDNFGVPRTDHAHTGVDILAAYGEPIHAPFAGTVSNSGSAGGLIVTLTAPDGSFVVGKHLSGSASEGTVAPGDVIGYVGKLDDSRAHLHFEWHPEGGPPTDPSPLLAQVCS